MFLILSSQTVLLGTQNQTRVLAREPQAVPIMVMSRLSRTAAAGARRGGHMACRSVRHFSRETPLGGITRLSDVGVLRLSGADAVKFLQVWLSSCHMYATPRTR